MEDTDVQLILDRQGHDYRLGSGTSGEVCLGVYKESNLVAIKVLKNLYSEEFGESVFKEIDVLRACRHPHIVQFQGVTFVDGRLSLVMEFMDGGDLSHALQRSKTYMWSDRGPRVAFDVASALAYLHSHNFIHMDVKPLNVLLTQDGRAKLGDLGMVISLAAMQSPCISSGLGRHLPLHGSRGVD
eukprot:jgi/Botrbrau1/3164/Bobra.0070s0128.2